MITDYELLINAKNNHTESINTLYHRYIPLISKHSNRIYKGNCFDAGDYAQDAFIRFIRAVKFVKLDKISNKFSWKFYQAFEWFLLNLDKKYRKIQYEEYFIESHSHHVEQDDNRSEDYDSHLTFIDHNLTEWERTADKQAFFKKLTPIQKNILQRRQSDQTIMSIAKDLDVSYGTIHRHIYLAKKLARTIIL